MRYLTKSSESNYPKYWRMNKTGIKNKNKKFGDSKPYRSLIPRFHQFVMNILLRE